ncbi:MAG TPA: right-handed parallel beta-helix repeat-containing protein, partial [Acidimicrobiia bacterium]|nr:right-handed parallel beta-helix repeat-containing protein [Acidimicrobiia bacterium]
MARRAIIACAALAVLLVPSAKIADFTSGTFNGRSRSVSGGGAVPIPVRSRPRRDLALSPIRCTRFVSTFGSDTNDGSSSAPFGTISHAEAAARPGDVVCVRGGTYREDVRLTRSGAKASLITVAGAPGESAIIDGTNLPIGPTDALLGIAGGTDYVTVRDLTIRNSPGRGVVNGGSHNRVVHTRIFHTRNAGLLTTNLSAAATDNEYVGNDISDAVYGNDCHVSSDSCTNPGGWESAVNVYDEGTAPAGHNLYESNRIHDNDGEGMIVMDGDVVRSNTLYDNFSVEIYLDRRQHVVIERNLLYESETKYVPIGGNQSYRLLAEGVSFADEFAPARTSHNIIRDNMIINVRTGIHFWNAIGGSGLLDDLVENNTIVNSWDYGISFDASTSTAGTVLRNNLVVPRQGSPTRGVIDVSGIALMANLFVSPGDFRDPHVPGEGTFSFDPNGYKLPSSASYAIDKGVA